MAKKTPNHDTVHKWEKVQKNERQVEGNSDEWETEVREVDVRDETYVIFCCCFRSPFSRRRRCIKKTVPFPCPLVLFLYTVAWWVNATPLQLPPTPSPPRPIHPALQPTHLTHSDVSHRWRGGSDSATHRVLPTPPTPPPAHVFAGFLLLASSLLRSLLFFFSYEKLWCIRKIQQ